MGFEGRTDADTWEGLVASLDRAHARLCAASAEFLEAVSDLEEFEQAPEDGWEALSTWLAARYGEGSGTAAQWVRVGEALRSLPAIRAAHGAGRISWDQLKPLSRFASAETDEHLARETPGMRPSRLWREAHRHRRAVQQREAETDHQIRRLWMGWDDDRRFLSIHGELPAEQGARVEEALTRRAEEVVLEEGPMLDRGGARLADALVELVTSEGGRSTETTLVVHADARMVLGQARPGRISLGETESGIQLTDETVRRLDCGARVEWVAEADGRAVGIGRQGRVVPGWLGRELRHRDPECRFPGCGRRKWLVIHHIVPWARGGPTDLDNLIRVCTTHHRQLHENGWRVTGHPDRSLRFHDPGGRPFGSFNRSSSPARGTALR